MERVERARQESDTAWFYDLLLLGELVAKLHVVAAVAAIREEAEGHRYRLEYRLVRADGLGEWVDVLDDALVGPASQHLAAAFQPDRIEISKSYRQTDDAWQADTVTLLNAAARHASIPIAQSDKVQLRAWFRRFAELRNKTRAHGAPTAEICMSAAPPLAQSIQLIIDRSPVLRRSWAVVRRGVVGKYYVSVIGGIREPFEHLTTQDHHRIDDGTYVEMGNLRKVPLVSTGIDGGDFYLGNGGFDGRSYEGISYASGSTRRVDGRSYLIPPRALPASKTQGLPALGVVGQRFSTLPPPPEDFVERESLERQLAQVLMDDRHPVVTLVGVGGVGKTSLALHVLHDLPDAAPFIALLWFSARDIDLLPSGPKQVKPHLLAPTEIAREFTRLMGPAGSNEKQFDSNEYFARSLAGQTDVGPMVFVFDNFETLRSPEETYAWIDEAIRLPNKALITTRMRDFKGDFPVEVKGMTRTEFHELVRTTSVRLGIDAEVTDAFTTRLFAECDGHPYVAKVLLGELAATGTLGAVPRILGDKEEILDALFERTFARLTPAAQRVFLTLSAWRSMVPMVALRAAMLRPVNERIDVDDAVDLLVRSSLADLVRSEVDDQLFVTVPLTGSIFGQRRLSVEPIKTSIEADLQVLHLFGPTQVTDLNRGLDPRIDNFFRNASDRLKAGRESDLWPVMELIAQSYPPAWLRIAELRESRSEKTLAAEALRRYLQARPGDREGWLRLAALSRSERDYLGEMHALLELSGQPGTSFLDLSETANRFNELMRSSLRGLDRAARLVMAEKLRRRMEPRIEEANATDLSRLGWLCVHLRDFVSARKFAERGLEMEPRNAYCRRLAEVKEWNYVN